MRTTTDTPLCLQSPRRPVLGALATRLGIAAAVFFLAIGCGSGESGSTENSSATPTDANPSRGAGRFGANVPATPVSVAEVQRGSIPRLLRSAGRLRARRNADVSAGLGGQILAIHVEIGDDVNAGDVLATFDVVEYERAREDARLTQHQREGELRRARLRLDQAKTELARAEDERFPQGYDTALYTLEQYENLRLNVRDAEVGLDLARYAVDAAELARQRAEREYELCYVRAPFTGTVAARHIEPFDRVSQGEVLFALVDTGDLEIRIRITEGEATAVRPGQAAIIASRGRLPIAYAAQVDRVSPVVDVEQGVVEVIVRVMPWRDLQGLHLWGQMQQSMRLIAGPVPGHLPTFPLLASGTTPPLRPGMFVAAEIATAIHPNAILCPKEAIQYDGDQPYVYVVRSRGPIEVATRTPIRLRTEFATPESIEVESGLEPGDRVVVRQADLRDGAPVRIVAPN